LADLKGLLYELYLEAGAPRLDQIEKWAALGGQAGMPGRDTIARIIGSATMPPSQADLITVVMVLARAAQWDDPEDAVRRARDMWVAAKMDSARTPAGGMLASQVDPRRLGVHAAISVAGMADEVPPEYVPRDADDGEFGLRARVATAAERGGFVLLVGSSSVGKSRSAFEAVSVLLPDWWLVHPAGPGDVAALASAPTARTVVWLDELQRYLDGEHGLTGGVVRALLSASHPVVIIGTLWPDRHTAYTSVPVPGADDPYAREREVLDLATVIHIDSEFSPAEKDRTRAAATRDRRLAVALGAAGYGLTQTLAAAPQLVARWENAGPYARAVLTAALDAARLGVRATLSADFLRAAAPGYCSSQQQAEAPENWFEQALTYATGKLHGTAAALSPVGAGMGRVAGYAAADYLLQHASRERRYARVPASTWDAILGHVRLPADADRLAHSARNRLLYRYAIPLFRHAANAGNKYAAYRLADLLEKRGALDEAEQILRGRVADGDKNADAPLAALLVKRGALDEAEQILRGRVAAGDRTAGSRLAALLAERGDLDEVRALVDARRVRISRQLARFLFDHDDLDEVRARADAGSIFAAEQLAGMLAKRGDLDELRTRADAGDARAASHLARLLAERGNLDELRARAAAGGKHAADQLAMVLAERGDLDEAARILRSRADNGDEYAAYLLDDLQLEYGDLAELRARADAGDSRLAADRLAYFLEKRGYLDEAAQVLRDGADNGDAEAAFQLANLLAKRGDLDELRARADAGEEYAASRLIRLLAERGDLDELRAQAVAGAYAADQLSDLLAGVLTKQGRTKEADQLRRFGLNPDGSTASK
jgi:hypothetical protein